RLEAAIAVDEHEAHRVHQDLVRLRREVVLIAVEPVSDREDALTALLERRDLLSELLELAQARAAQTIGLKDERLDAVVVLRGANRVDQVLEQRFPHLRALHFRERPLEWIARQLIDEHALRGDHQRRGVRHAGTGPRQRGRDDQQEQEQQEQMQELADAVDDHPGRSDYASEYETITHDALP